MRPAVVKLTLKTKASDFINKEGVPGILRKAQFEINDNIQVADVSWKVFKEKNVDHVKAFHENIASRLQQLDFFKETKLSTSTLKIEKLVAETNDNPDNLDIHITSTTEPITILDSIEGILLYTVGDKSADVMGGKYISHLHYVAASQIKILEYKAIR